MLAFSEIEYYVLGRLFDRGQTPPNSPIISGEEIYLEISEDVDVERFEATLVNLQKTGLVRTEQRTMQEKNIGQVTYYCISPRGVTWALAYPDQIREAAYHFGGDDALANISFVLGEAADTTMTTDISTNKVVEPSKSNSISFETANWSEMPREKRPISVTDFSRDQLNSYMEGEADFPEFIGFREAILTEMVHRDYAIGDAPVNLAELASDSGLFYRIGWVLQAAYELHEQGLIRAEVAFDFGPDAKVTAEVTEEGVKYVHENVEKGNRPEVAVPASDRVVPLDHNQPEFEEAVKSVDALQELVRGNNEFAAEDPEEHSQIVSELSAIRNLLEAQQIDPSRFKAFAWGTFAYLIEKFGDGPISAAADLAWKALSQLLGLA